VAEADSIIVAGVATALAGSLVAAPDGAFLIVKQAVKDIRKALHWIFHPREWRRHGIVAQGEIRLAGLGHMGGDIQTEERRRPILGRAPINNETYPA
jgi:hypothetical protein